MGRTQERGCGFQPYKHTQHLKKNNTALTELNYCLHQSGLPRKQDIPVHTHSHGEQARTSSAEEEGAREPSSGHSCCRMRSLLNDLQTGSATWWCHPGPSAWSLQHHWVVWELSALTCSQIKSNQHCCSHLLSPNPAKGLVHAPSHPAVFSSFPKRPTLLHEELLRFPQPLS